MSNQWFRFYAEALEDPKVQSLTPKYFKIWVNILCLACKTGGKLPSAKAVAFSLRMQITETKLTLLFLKNQGLLDLVIGTTDCFIPHSWENRQYKSDSSTERVKRFRNVSEITKEAFQKQDQIQNTDTERKKEETKTSKGSRLTLTDLPGDWRQFCLLKRPELDPDEVFAEFKDFWAGVPGQRGRKSDWDATWRNRVRDKKQTIGGKYEKPSFQSTGQKLAEKYRRNAEREEQSAIGRDADSGLHLAETIR